MCNVKPENPTVFIKTPWDESALAPEFAALQQMRWGRYTDNFIVANCASDTDWFSDADWATVLYNIGVVAKAAKAGGCKGIAFDPESYPDYTTSPWCYGLQTQHTTKTYDQYRVIVRKRGAQFLRAIQQQLPQPTILIYYGYDLYANEQLNPNVNSDRLNNHIFGLLAEFLNGMLDAATPGTTILNDGNEESYYYTTPQEFTDARTRVTATDAQYAAPDLANKYPSYIRNAPAMYPDYIFDLFTQPFTWRPLYSKFLKPNERSLWWEHNVYYGLLTCDNYIWMYAEHTDFANNINIPSGLISGVIAAKQKIANNQPLGYSIDSFMAKAKRHFR